MALDERGEAKSGRPRNEEPTTVLAVRLPVVEFDALCELARDQRETLSGLALRLLRQAALDHFGPGKVRP